jgi:hypothetical protein
MNAQNGPCAHFSYDDDVVISLDYQKLGDDARVSFIWKLFDMNDSLLFATSTMFRKSHLSEPVSPRGLYNEQTVIPKNFLNTGRFHLTLACIVDNRIIDTFHRCASFEVVQSKWMMTEPWSRIPAAILNNFKWEKIRK